MSAWEIEWMSALTPGDDGPALSEHQMVAALSEAVSGLNRLMQQARRHEIEVTLDVSYDRILDGHRPHVALVQLKVVKVLDDRRGER